MADTKSHTPSSDSSQPVPSGAVRRLAAIMFTDIKDFAKKMQRDETATLHMLEIHNRMMRETVGKYRGNVIKTIGDAFLVSFESVVDATACAVETQQNFYAHNAGKPAEERINVRIGVHLGDVFVKDKDVFGDGVNIASRIQSMSEPGDVNISDSVYQQVRNKLDIRVLKLGAPQLKGIREAIQVYQVIVVPGGKMRSKFSANWYITKTLLKRKKSKRVLAGAVVLVLAIAALWPLLRSAPALNSLAVIPFENLGSEQEEYISDGLAEEIISQLAKIPGVLVISKSSSFAFKGSDLDDRTIARDMRVQFLLKGSVKVIADQLLVTTYLVDGATGERVSTDNYIISRNDIFQLQYEIPRQIAQRFNLQFVSKVETTRPDVYDIYTRGLFEHRKLRRESNLAAIGHFEEALRKDSNFTPARVALAKAQYVNYDYGWDQSFENLNAAERNCQRALKVDSTNAEVIATLGRVMINKGEREEGVELLEQALKYDSRNYIALTALGREALLNLNKPAAGISYFQRAMEVEPTNFILASNIGVAYGMLKNYQAALEAFRHASLLNPNHDYPYQNLALAFERSGRYDSAVHYYRVAVEKNPLGEELYLYWGELLLSLGRHADAETVLTTGMRQAPGNVRVPYALGIALGKLGKTREATKIWGDALKTARLLVNVEPLMVKHLSYSALLSARLKNSSQAVAYVQQAIRTDSTNSEVFFDAARVYAILGKKRDMLEMFGKARSMNPDYDASYLATSVDFESYQKDPDLLAAAQ